MQAYYDLVYATYHGKDQLDMDTYFRLWVCVGLDRKTASEIIAEANRQVADRKRIALIRKIYPKMVARQHETIPKNPVC